MSKSGLGDLEMHPNGQLLYAMNLHTRTIEVLPVVGNPRARSAIGLNWNIISADPAVQADLRPFGLEFLPTAGGRFLYVGVVDSAERKSAAAPRAYVVSIDTTRPGDQYVVMSVDLLSPEIANRFENSSSWKGVPAWFKWGFESGSWGNPVRHPQPILSDIEFSADGTKMMLGFRDRAGDQFWSLNPPEEDNHVVVAQGDTLLYEQSGGTWKLRTTALDVVKSDFWNDNYIGNQKPPNHSENHGGAMAWTLHNTNGATQEEVVVNSITPFTGSTGGVTWYAMNARERVAANELIPRGHPAQGKAQRLGDVEILCTEALIGDYVWRDDNRNGQQDTNEPPIQGVVLELLDGAAIAATATTDAKGLYLFAVQPGKPYTIRVAASNPALAGLVPTGLDQGGSDAFDSDLNPATKTIAVPAQLRSAYNMTFDLGFVTAPPQPPSLCSPGQPGCPSNPTPTPPPVQNEARVGDLVWNDLDADGIQDAGEPGIGGVTVELLNAGADSMLLTTTTDASGYYEFRVPVIASPAYRVRVQQSGLNASVLNGFSRSPRDAGGNDAQDSDADNAGTTPSVAAPASSRNMTLDFGFFRPTNVTLVKTGPGVAERGSQFTYSITATNTTQQLADQVRVVDTLPAGVLFVSATPQAEGIASSVDTQGNSSTSLSWALGQLGPGQSKVMQITVRVKDSASGSLVNVARISTVSFGDNPGDNTTTWTTTIPDDKTDVSIDKDGPAEVGKDVEFVYTLTYRNNGPADAKDLRIDDAFPPNFVFVSATPAPSYADNYGATWHHNGDQVNVLPAGAGRTITIRGRLSVAGSYINRAEVRTRTAETTYTNNRDQVTTIVQGPPQINLSIDKQGPTTIEPGKQILYYFDVRETTGNRTAENVIITDTLPAGTSFLSVTASSQIDPWRQGRTDINPSHFEVTQQGSLISINLGTVPASYQDRLYLRVQGPSAAPADLLNRVRIDTTTDETSYSDNEDTHPTVVRVTPADSIGDRVFLDYDGNGQRDAAKEPGIPNARLDLYRYGQTFGSNGSCAPTSASSYVRSTTSDQSGTYIFEQAVPATDPVRQGGDMVVLPTANFAANGPLAGLTLTSYAANGTGSDNNIGVFAKASPDGLCSAPYSGGTNPNWTAYRRAGLPEGTIFIPWMTMQPYDPAGYRQDTPYQRYRADFGLLERWNLAVHKDGPTSALAGQEFTYTLSISNTRGAEQVAAVVTDTLPAGLEFVNAIPAPSRVNGRVLEWDLSVGAGASRVITVRVRTPSTMPGRVVKNQVCASAMPGEYDLSDNCSPEVPTEIVPRADLVVEKIGSATVTAGDQITFTLRYTNEGQAVATGVVLTDTLPAGFLFLNATPAPLIDAQTLIWEIGDLAIGESGTILLTVRVDGATPNNTARTNTVRGSTTTPEPTDNPDGGGSPGAGSGGKNSTDNNDWVVTTVRNADISIDKRGPASAAAGPRWVYTLQYANAGPAPARNVVVTDQLPQGLTIKAQFVKTVDLAVIRASRSFPCSETLNTACGGCWCGG